MTLLWTDALMPAVKPDDYDDAWLYDDGYYDEGNEDWEDE